MRCLFPALLLLAGCASDMQGNWPTLAHRPGEIAIDGTALPTCPGCGADMTARPPPPAAPLPLPGGTEQRLAATAAVIAEAEAKVPAQARRANAAIAAARLDAGRSGDAEVERSRFENLFLSLTIEDRRLDQLADEVAGRDGSDAVMARIAELRARLVALETARESLAD